MTAELPAAVAAALAQHEAFESTADGFRVRTVVFDATVTASESEGVGDTFTVVVRAPMLDEAVDGETVGPTVEEGWFETYGRRLADATGATRARVELESFDLTEENGEAVAEFTYTYGDAEQGIAIAKTIAEFTEGTYVQGVIPGYDYRSPVADLLQQAKSTGSGGDRSGTPL
ncbi:MAG: DUF5813 family protein [archaeon]